MNIATVGTGSIVNSFLSAVNDLDDVKCVAMYSRKKQNAGSLAEKYKVASIYTDYEEMLKDPSIEFIYIASPNSLHYEYAYHALNNGKHVICEKPFTSTLKETENLMELAKRKELMLFEAITTIHMPNYRLVKEQIHKLGRIRFIQCNYSQYSSRYNQLISGETPNVFSLKYSGGALTDINIYNLHFVMNLCGSPQTISYMANKHENGIDTSGVLLLKYPDFIAECVGCKDSNSMNFVLIQGEKGYLHVENGANGCRRVIVHLDDEEVSLNMQTNSNRLYYEVAAFYEVYKNKDFKRCYELLDYTYSVMKTLVEARRSAGIFFEADQKE